ncbi:Peroxisomal acyl-coenzyme a thioester hydrolase, putative [Penicillium digitatum PHI26]|uniref:Peroxisomal acyl-coenzyme a thioester hydrolase, putative n=2 Tax=Penicillium digitatum TaxID=36651 RepID=K9FHF8_PEND2|nr:Peroxisomal acyl-coenzyme a thioester hydrolase, putative [Penicillium digitatum Pd1]EKV06772.1 Peroxisomal acyl-coenzyme a thioester hydrolase, putative [Penicillium digitatum Pd1]EKV08885.1 Peroxisomal acyl-coenzyme a thioester hydrolase, putative [Penicillium digitatum PHI26]
MSPQRGAPDNYSKLTSPHSFIELMSLQRLEDALISFPDSTESEKIERFRSLARPFNPGQGTRSFGGHVYAQSAYAASKTVGQGLVIHPISAHTRFDSILSVKRPEDQPLSPSVDAEWWIEAVRQGKFSEHEFPGLDVRKTDMKDYNRAGDVKQHPERYRQLTQYRLKGSPDENPAASLAQIREREETGQYDNLYACAHMYSSDKNSLFLITRALGIDHWTEMASLTLTFILHQHGEALRMVDWEMIGDGDVAGVSEFPMKWFVQEGWTPRAAENRGTHESHLWSPDGTLLATSLQDSMLRLKNLGLPNL